MPNRRLRASTPMIDLVRQIVWLGKFYKDESRRLRGLVQHHIYHMCRLMEINS